MVQLISGFNKDLGKIRTATWMSPLGEKIRKSWKSDCGAGTKCCESYLPMISAQEKRNKCMFHFHPSQEEIKMGKWIFLGPGSRIFGVSWHYSAVPCGTGVEHGHPVALRTHWFSYWLRVGVREDQSSPPRLQSRQGRMSRAPRRVKRTCKKLLKLKTLGAATAATIILASLG